MIYHNFCKKNLSIYSCALYCFLQLKNYCTNYSNVYWEPNILCYLHHYCLDTKLYLIYNLYSSINYIYNTEFHSQFEFQCLVQDLGTCTVVISITVISLVSPESGMAIMFPIWPAVFWNFVGFWWAVFSLCLVLSCKFKQMFPILWLSGAWGKPKSSKIEGGYVFNQIKCPWLDFCCTSTRSSKEYIGSEDFNLHHDREVSTCFPWEAFCLHCLFNSIEIINVIALW